MAAVSDNSLYQSVHAALDLMNCDIGPAECHGMLCGMLCAGTEFDPSQWLNHATGYQGELNINQLGNGHALVELLNKTITGFSSEDFALRVLIPDDDEPIAERVEAIGAWCRGFLSGFGLPGTVDVTQLSDDSQGFLRDLGEIGKVDFDDADGEADEVAFMEIC